MTEAVETMPITKPKKHWNWWMIAFFILLIVFEFMRELVVLTANVPPRINATPILYNGGDFVAAEGALVRTDKGSPLIPTSVAISCYKVEQICIEANVHVMDNSVSAPDITRYRAHFANDGVTYTKDNAACATYKVRMDFALEKVMMVMEPKVGPKATCDIARVERMTMELGDDIADKTDYTKDIFIPLFRILRLLNR